MDTLDERESDFNLAKDSGTVRFQPNHQLMASPQLRQRDRRPQRIFFYERYPERSIMVWTEAEAAMMVKSSHRFMLVQIGCSNGDAYRKYVQGCGVKPGETIPKERAQEILDGAMKAEMEAARGNLDDPEEQNVHFDSSFKKQAQRDSFVPPA